MMHFHSFLNACVDLVRTTESGDVLRNLGLFDLGEEETFKTVPRHVLHSLIHSSRFAIQADVA